MLLARSRSISRPLPPIQEEPTVPEPPPPRLRRVTTQRKKVPPLELEPPPAAPPPDPEVQRALFEEGKALYHAGIGAEESKPRTQDSLKSAAMLFQQAANVFEELGQTGRVRKCCWKVAINTASLGHLLKKQKDRKGAIKSFLEARELFRLIGENTKEAQCLFQLGLVYETTKEFEEAMSAVKDAATLFVAEGEEGQEARCYCELAHLHERKDPTTAQFFWKQALIIFCKLTDPAKEARTLFAIASLACSQKDYATATAYFLQARIIFKRNGDTLHEGHTSYQLGKLAGKAQQRVSCVQYFEEASECYRSLGLKEDEAWCLYRLGLCMFKCKDEITAVDYFTEARTLFAWVGCQEAEGSCLLRLGEAFMEADPAFAKGCLTEYVDPVRDRTGRRSTVLLEGMNGGGSSGGASGEPSPELGGASSGREGHTNAWWATE